MGASDDLWRGTVKTPLPHIFKGDIRGSLKYVEKSLKAEQEEKQLNNQFPGSQIKTERTDRSVESAGE